MAQLLPAWLRQRTELELGEAIKWQDNVAKGNTEGVRRVKLEPNKYRYNGQKLRINIPIKSANRPHIQFVNFSKPQPPYPCFVADGEFRIDAQFSAECENRFREKTGWDLSKLASGVVLGLDDVELIIYTDARKSPFSLVINDVVALNILQEANQIGRRNSLDAVEALPPLLTKLVELLSTDGQVRGNPSTVHSPASLTMLRPPVQAEESHSKATPHESSRRLGFLSQLQTESSAELRDTNVHVIPDESPKRPASMRPSSSTSLRGRGRGRGRGYSQMGDRSVALKLGPSLGNKSLQVSTQRVADSSRHDTYYTEEDDAEQVHRIPSKNEDRQGIKRRVDSSIDSDPHSAQSSNQPSPTSASARIIADQGLKPSEIRELIADHDHAPSSDCQDRQQEEQAVTSPLAQSQPLSTTHPPPVSLFVQPSRGAKAPEPPSLNTRDVDQWYGVERMTRSLSIIETDQAGILRQPTSLYPPRGLQSFAPANIPLVVLQEEIRRAESLAQVLSHEGNDATPADDEDSRARSGDQTPQTPSAASGTPIGDWLPTPTREQHDRPALPPDSSPPPEVSPIKTPIRRMTESRRLPLPTQEAALKASQQQSHHDETNSGGRDEHDEDMQDIRLPGLDLIQGPPVRTTGIHLHYQDLSSTFRREDYPTTQQDEELEAGIPYALGDAQSTPASRLPQQSSKPTSLTKLSPPSAARAVKHYSSSASAHAVQVCNTDESRRFRSTGDASPRIPSTYQPSRSPRTQPARATMSFDESSVFARNRFNGRSSPIKSQPRPIFDSRPAMTQHAPSREMIPPTLPSGSQKTSSQPPALTAQTQSTQRSSAVSQDPAKEIGSAKSTFVDKLYRQAGLLAMFSEAYPFTKFAKPSFDSILRYKLWPAREEIPAKNFDDFVIQYKQKYERYVLEQELKGLEKLPYLDFYRRIAAAEPTRYLNRIITYERLNTFMADGAGPATSERQREVNEPTAERLKDSGLNSRDSMDCNYAKAQSSQKAQIFDKLDQIVGPKDGNKRPHSTPEVFRSYKKRKASDHEHGDRVTDQPAGRRKRRAKGDKSHQQQYHDDFQSLLANQRADVTGTAGSERFWTEI